MFDAAAIIPFNQIVWILLTMVSGNPYSQEFNRFSQLQFIMFGSGMALVLVGIYLLVPRGEACSKSEAQQLPDDGVKAYVAQVGRGSNTKLSAMHDSCHVSIPEMRDPSQSSIKMLSSIHQVDVQAVLMLPKCRILTTFDEVSLLPRSVHKAQILEQTLQHLANDQAAHTAAHCKSLEDSLFHEASQQCKLVTQEHEESQQCQSLGKYARSFVTQESFDKCILSAKPPSLQGLCTAVQAHGLVGYLNHTNPLSSQGIEQLEKMRAHTNLEHEQLGFQAMQANDESKAQK